MNDMQVVASKLISVDLSDLKKKIIAIWVAMTESNQTFRSILALFSSNMTASVLTAIGGVLAARFVGPEETGAFRAFTIPLSYLYFLQFGTFDGLWRQIPFYVGKGIPEKVEVLASAAGAFNILLSIVVTFGFICCSGYSLLHYGLYGFFGWFSQAVYCWWVFYGGYLGSTYRTLNHFVTWARLQMVQIVVSFGMVFLLPFIGFYGLCARAVLPFALGLWLCQRSRPLRVRYRFDKKALGELIKIGLPLNFWGSLWTITWAAIESTLVLALGGVTGLGLFTAAIVMREGLNVLPTSVYHVLTPRVITTLAKDGSVRNANARVMWLTIVLTVLMVIVALIVTFLLDILVPYVIPKYVDAIPIMRVCGWFPVVQAAFLPTNTLYATGKPWLYGRSIIVGYTAFALATYVLVPVIGGVLAVAVGSLVGRAARTAAAYMDLFLLARREKFGEKFF